MEDRTYIIGGGGRGSGDLSSTYIGEGSNRKKQRNTIFV